MTISPPLALTYPELLATVLSCRALYVPPFVVKRTPGDVRSVVHAIMVVSKLWNEVMRELIVPLMNNRTIEWSYLPGIQGKRGGMNPIYKFLSQSNRASGMTRLHINGDIELNTDRLGEIVKLCVNIRVLSIADKMFDLNHLVQLPHLKQLDMDRTVPLNVSVLGQLPLEVLKVNRSQGNPTWTHFEASTSLKKLYIHARTDQFIEGVPDSLESLTLFKTYFTVEDAFRSLSQLKHLSFTCFDADFPSLKNLKALDSLEISCEAVPEGYLEDVPQIRRLKICFTQNLPSLGFFRNLTELCLKVSYSSETFKELKNLKKLVLDSWNKMPEEVSFYHNLQLEVLSIRSNRLVNIQARTLTQLVYLKVNCVGLKELTLPAGLTAKVNFCQKVDKRFIIKVPRHEVLLF